MILKEWVAQYMMNSNIGQPINSFDEVFEMLDFENLWGYLFKCTAKYTWMECLIATESEIEEELAWALERPGVKLRHARADYSASARAEAKLCVLQSHFAAKEKAVNGIDTDTDRSDTNDAGTFFFALTTGELKHYQKYHKQFGGDYRTYDLGQDPSHRALVSKPTGSLNTLIRGMGLMMMDVAAWPKPCQRWLCAPELFEISGFPISHESQEASGTVCQFSRGAGGAACKTGRRTRRSSTQQLGNAIHIGVIGPWTLLLVLQLPMLAKFVSTAAKEDEPPTKKPKVMANAFGRAFACALKGVQTSM